MMTQAELVGIVMLFALTFYALGGGADFGGGVWDLLARGPRTREQRDLIASAIGPIWEANHVWLILVIVLLFVAFPAAFSAISIALHIPLTVMLIGIVLRGSAFVFRSYDTQRDDVQRRWSRLFAAGSIVSPLMLGVCVGAVASGQIRVDVETGVVQTNFFSQWMAPFPFAIGFFVLALFAFLAAVYLAWEAKDPMLKDDFRQRALWSGIAVAVTAFGSLLLAGDGAPMLRSGLAQSWWALPFQLLTGAVAVMTLAALWLRKFHAARVLAISQVALIIWGWGFSQFPFLVAPNLTFTNSAAPDNILRSLLIALAAGAVLLLPSLWYLFRVFKRRED
ncbi:MAG TPA: cytochrome d ubiquinol oxidase subunit II [Verrucomicrobiae bacterium]|nr:cytochrome d ubiquinol oxidase subunit II [Verrucomicrobiae bacterium]